MYIAGTYANSQDKVRERDGEEKSLSARDPDPKVWSLLNGFFDCFILTLLPVLFEDLLASNENQTERNFVFSVNKASRTYMKLLYEPLFSFIIS